MARFVVAIFTPDEWKQVTSSLQNDNREGIGVVVKLDLLGEELVREMGGKSWENDPLGLKGVNETATQRRSQP